jgi:hypothetical protein
MRIHGRFCETKKGRKTSFARRSFRWKKSGRAWLLIACPKSKWKSRSERCSVGTRAYAVLVRAKKGQACCEGRKGVCVTK